MSVFLPTATGATCTVRVTPRAGRTAITAVRDGQLIVRVAAAPVDGAANAVLVDWLADAFHRPRRSVAIVRGERGRTKHVTFQGVSPHVLAARLEAIMGAEDVGPKAQGL